MLCAHLHEEKDEIFSSKTSFPKITFTFFHPHFDSFSFWAGKNLHFGLTLFHDFSFFSFFLVWIFAVKKVKIQSPEVERVCRCHPMWQFDPYQLAFQFLMQKRFLARHPRAGSSRLSFVLDAVPPDSQSQRGRSAIVCVTYYTGALVGPNVWPRLPVAFCGRLLVHIWSRYHGLHS